MFKKMAVISALIVVLAAALPAGAQDAADIVRATIDNWRGQSSYGKMSMTIHRPSWERSMSMRRFCFFDALKHGIHFFL